MSSRSTLDAIQFVERAMKRSAAIVHRQMGERLSHLATVASVAPLLGMFGTVVGIVNSFPGMARRETVFELLSYALVPTAMALFVAVPSLWCYVYLTARLERINLEIDTASLELVNRLILAPGRLSAAADAGFITTSLIFRDDIGDELREEHRPWYRSGLAIAGMLITSWFVQIVRYIDSDFPLESAMPWACVYVAFTFGLGCFVAYPVWLNLMRRSPGGMVALASVLCLFWSLVEIFLHVHLW